MAKSVVHLVVNLFFLIAFLSDTNFTSGSSKSFKQLLFIPRGSAKAVRKRAAPRENEWSEFSCCRRALGIQTREKALGRRFVQIEYRECAWDYCKECVDDLDYCVQLRDLQGACNLESDYLGFMSIHCPKTCSWCDPPPTTAPMSTTESALLSNLQRIQIFFLRMNGINIYNFNAFPEPPPLPWKANSESPYEEEVDSFNLYSESTGNFTMQVAFCTYETNGNQIWIVTKGRCNREWTEEIVLFASKMPLPETEQLFVANHGRFPWSSRIFRNAPRREYRSSIWDFFAPRFKKPDPSITTSTLSMQTSTIVSQKTTEEPSFLLGTDSKEKECLKYHDYFRAVHNVSPFSLDPDLTATAKRWAEYLAENAPTHPYATDPEFNRTQNWPHSDRGSYFRRNGVGENIAWDLSPEGSSPKESVLRWYAEIFDYDPSNPLQTRPNKPTGHFTQMLWKSSTHLGCAVAEAKVQRGEFEYISTYTVAHYAPSGNLRFQQLNQTVENYRKNVPSPKSGSCMSPEFCLIYDGEKSLCMGLSDKMSCKCTSENAGIIGGRPLCYGSGGCIVGCKEPSLYRNNGHHRWVNECHGKWSCECILFPKNGKIGAYCT